MKIIKKLILFILFNVSFAQFLPNWDSLDKRKLPKWYDDSKIGIFITWGLYSVPAFKSEWFWWYLHFSNLNFIYFILNLFSAKVLAGF